ncbi:MAG: hypothetical protein ACERKZ_20145 [Lachnotalea sp.]
MSNVNIIPYFPHGVRMTGNSIYDDALQFETKLNTTALSIFKLVDDKNSFADIIEKMNIQYGCKDNSILRDVNKLLFDANKRNIINFKIKSKNIVYMLLAKIVFSIIKRSNVRYDIFGNNLFKILIQLLRILIAKFIGLAIIINFSLLLILFLSNNSNYIVYGYTLQILVGINLLIIGSITSIALHESLHAYYFRKMVKQVNSGFFALEGITMSFKRRRDQNISGVWVELSGPFITFMIGAVGYFITYIVMPNKMDFYLYIFFFTYLVQILNLLPFSGDGRNILLRILFNK